MRILIDNVTVLTMNREKRVYTNGWLLTEDSQIHSVGEGTCPETFDERIDGRGGILMPGMVNTHCHVPMVPFRTMGDDCQDRLRRFLFPLEREAMTPELVYAASRYGICEMLLSGVTTFLDMYYFEEQVAQAGADLGIRAFVGQTVIDMETCDSHEPYGGLDLAEALIRKWSGHPRITPLVAPHATNTNSADALKKAHDLAEKYGTLFTLHASEMDYEMTYFDETYKKTPIQFLFDTGVLKGRTLAAHCIHLTDKDIQLLRQTDTTVSHCIGSNTKAGKGVAPVAELLREGISVGLGTDGPSSGNTLSLFPQLRLFASFHKTRHHDRGVFPAADIVELGTVGGARALHCENIIGSLEPGKKADLVLVETDSVQMFPCFNPYSALVYSADASNVSTVMVDGKILVRDKKLTAVDIREERQKLQEQMGKFERAAENYKDMI